MDISLKYNIEQRLWRNTFYSCIERMRSAQSQYQDATWGLLLDLAAETYLDLEKYLYENSSFLFKDRKKYNSYVGRIYGYLGDTFRYKANIIHQTQSDIKFDHLRNSMDYYKKALTCIPNQGKLDVVIHDNYE